MAYHPERYTPNDLRASVYQRNSRLDNGEEISHYGPFTLTFPHSNYRFVGKGYPDWKARIAAGLDATTLLTAVREEFSMPRLHWNSTSSAYGIRDEGYIDALDAVDPIDYSLTDVCLNKAKLAFVKAARSGFDSLTFAGELGKTLQMLKKPAAAIRASVDRLHALNKAERSRSRSQSEFRKRIAGTTLEFQMGWKPLMQDVKNASRVIDDLIKQKRDFLVKTVKVETSTSDGPTLGPFQVGYQTYRTYTKHKSSVTVILRGKCRTKTDASYSDRKFGTSVPDMINTGWQLLPYSFLIDYFTNIGDKLEMAAALSLVDFSWANFTIIKEGTSMTESVFDQNSFWTPITSSYHGAYTKRTVDRDKGVDLVVPDLQTVFSPTKNQALNVSALASNWHDDKNFRLPNYIKRR